MENPRIVLAKGPMPAIGTCVYVGTRGVEVFDVHQVCEGVLSVWACLGCAHSSSSYVCCVRALACFRCFRTKCTGAFARALCLLSPTPFCRLVEFRNTPAGEVTGTCFSQEKPSPVGCKNLYSPVHAVSASTNQRHSQFQSALQSGCQNFRYNRPSYLLRRMYNPPPTTTAPVFRGGPPCWLNFKFCF